MIVIDTNIIAPLYVQSVQTAAVTKLFARDQIWRTEPLALIELSTTAYDARFLAFAQQLECRLVTEDAKSRAAAPKPTQSVADALANA